MRPPDDPDAASSFQKGQQMLARLRAIREREDQGFTLIELLVVMIIIGILAAIAIPVYLNQQQKAEDTAVKNDVTTVGQAIASYYVDSGATAITASDLTIDATSHHYTLAGTDVGKASPNVTIDGSTAITDSQHWCVALTNSKGSQKTYHYSVTDGMATGVCP